MKPNVPTKEVMSCRSRQRAETALRLFLLILCFTAVVPAAANSDALVDQPYDIGYGDRLTTKIFIDGKGPFDFLIDTASSRTIIYERARAQVDIVPVNNERIVVYGLNGVLNAPAVRLGELRISGERVRGLTVATLPNPGGDSEEPDGILGLDVLERYFIILDRPKLRLRLFPRASGALEPYSTWPHVPLNYQKANRFSFGFWYIDGQYTELEKGTTPAVTLFDLGAGITILNWETAYRFKLRKWQLTNHTPTDQQVQDGLGKNAPVARLNGLWITIGDRSWFNESVLIADAPIFDLLDLGGRPAAIVGPGLLKDESFAVDFENQRLYIAPTNKED
jgi:hypothetical protein